MAYFSCVANSNNIIRIYPLLFSKRKLFVKFTSRKFSIHNKFESVTQKIDS